MRRKTFLEAVSVNSSTKSYREITLQNRKKSQQETQQSAGTPTAGGRRRRASLRRGHSRTRPALRGRRRRRRQGDAAALRAKRPNQTYHAQQGQRNSKTSLNGNGRRASSRGVPSGCAGRGRGGGCEATRGRRRRA